MGGNKIKISIAKPKKELKDKSKKKEMTAGEIKEKTENKSQLRHDLVSGDWVVIAGSRNCRPFDPGKLKPAWTKEEIERQSGSNCLFCDPEKTGQEKDVLIYKTSDDDWSLRIFPNKYPAFERPKGGPIAEYNEGPYYWMDSVGYHELIVTRDHNEDLSLMDPLKVAEVLDAYQTRYLDLMTKKSINYINIFHNHGPAAGSSIYHPHSQLAAIPVISPYIRLELDGAERYFRSKKNCVYCVMLEHELKENKRIVFQNDDFIVFCPFASRSAFEMWVTPREHRSYFERSLDSEKVNGGEALQEALRRLNKVLGNPAYNFYLHTSPCDGKDYRHYHWHIEILPKTSIWAGFELSTGIEISTMIPEEAAKRLREA